MTHERAPSEDASTDRDGEEERRRARSVDESSTEPAAEFGITDEDMEQIHSFLEKQRYSRSVDDLRPSNR